MTQLPCMAVKQPYASLLVAGIKDVENRNRALPDQLKGRWCAIYASRALAPVVSWVQAEWQTRALNADWPWVHHLKTARKQCTRGAIVGLVKWQASDRPYLGPLVLGRQPKGMWAEPGMHHWTYSDRIVLPEPVPLPDGGFQGLYWYLDNLSRSYVLTAVKAVATPWHELVYEEPEPLTDLTGCDV